MPHPLHAPEESPSALPRPRPVIGWPGGKWRLLKHLLPLVPEHTLYCEVFGGGLAMFCAKPPSRAEVINEINGELISFYRCAKYHLDPLLDELDLVTNSRREFLDYHEQRGLTEIQRAARWFIRNKLSFGGLGGTSFAISRKQPLGSRSNRLLAIRALSGRMDRTVIEALSWDKFFASYDDPGAFLFLDPPYLDGAGAAYDGWSEAELTRFATSVRALKGKWLLTYQDCDQVREAFRGYVVQAIQRANGIGNNSGQSGRVYREVVITSERREGAPARKGKGA